MTPPSPGVRLLGPALGAPGTAVSCAASGLLAWSHSERRGRSKRKQGGWGRRTDGSGWRALLPAPGEGSPRGATQDLGGESEFGMGEGEGDEPAKGLCVSSGEQDVPGGFGIRVRVCDYRPFDNLRMFLHSPNSSLEF